MRICINPTLDIEKAMKCDCHGCESIIENIADDYNEIIVRCPALPDGILCNKILTEDNWNGIDNYCNNCQNAYDVFISHAEPIGEHEEYD
mgnify:CR=1 FL=1|tara:strand:- start:1170 stop:1439 length:270 start_codon:yes stop_codon:yes gene_type:complete